jgi:exodeoxyribonuclease VII small subunit
LRGAADCDSQAQKSGNSLLTETPDDLAKLPFEAALAELESIVDKLEKGATPLEESIKIYERGEALKAHCDRLLREAEMRIEKITLGADGKPKGVEPLDPK